MTGSVPADAADGRVTPMMAQYCEIKANNPGCLLFYRMGDFFELFFEDAEIASRALGIALTKRGKHLGADIPMCGVPVDRSDDYLHRLIALGHRVAICEQTEDPAEAKKRGGKSVVRRAVVRLVTPGTLTEDRLLEPAQANRLVALARRRVSDTAWSYGLAALDISTGRFDLSEIEGGALAAEIARLDPREIVLPDTVHDDPDLRALWKESRASLSPLPRDGLDAASAERRLKEFFGVATLDAFGDFSRVEIAAAGAALAYVEKTQLGARPALAPPARVSGGGSMLIDPATRANLELVRTLAGERTGSLLAALDRTVTAAGGRLLADRLAGPLTDATAVAARQEAVAFLLDERDLRAEIRALLGRAPDLVRALSRLSLERGGPRDLSALRDGLAAAEALAERLARAPAAPAEIAGAAAALGGLDPALLAALRDLLADELPLHRRDGGFVRAGHDPLLDETRELATDSRRVIAALQARYAAETGIRTLRIKHNNLLGFFVEVPAAAGEDLARDRRDTFIHRQTMAGAMRFTTTELGDLETRVSTASDRALRLELAHFEAIAARAVAAARPIGEAAAALASLDVAAALAERAEEGGWTRPRVDGSLAFAVTGARHPVVEAALAHDGQPFIANDTAIGGEREGRILLVTGPNMGGKSTYLRQNAILAVLAQMGSYVPAASCHLGIVDRLFSRVGAADDLARGRSTFMVEMVETAAILNQATPCSLVVLDEIGRGTATFDGLSIAWAAIEHLHETNRCRALFATHFHELTALAERLPRLSNATLRMTEWDGEVVFLHEVVPGAADRSYGLQVAKLAGLPEAVVARARTILTELEKQDREHPRTPLVDDLPLFAAARPPPSPAPRPAADPLRDALATIDPDELTPRGALEALYRLKAAASPPRV